MSTHTRRSASEQESLAAINSVNADIVAKKHAAIAKEYAWDGRRRYKRPAYSLFDNLRMREIERFLQFKYGSILPDDDGGIDDLFVAIHHIVKIAERPDEAVQAWARRWAPWCSPDKVTAIVDGVFERPMRWKADELARRLGLTDPCVRISIFAPSAASMSARPLVPNGGARGTMQPRPQSAALRVPCRRPRQTLS
jgi:hypothetical protein